MSYTPPRSAISAITQADPCVVTTSTNHDLTTGQVVRVHVPQNYGMVELNQKQVFVTVLTPTTFSLQAQQYIPININSTNFTAFTIPSNPSFTAEIIPMGAGSTLIGGNPVNIQNNVAASLIEDATTNQSLTEIPF